MVDGVNGLFPDTFDSTYFMDAPWSERVERWIELNQSSGFSTGNVDMMRQMCENTDTGLRMVVNITAKALLGVLREGEYKNLYDNPVIGSDPKEPSAERQRVDLALGIGENTYFGAVALGGAGVRFYGEYCMVLTLARLEMAPTALFDRDSFDILLDPLIGLTRGAQGDPLGPTVEQLACLRGTWSQDRVHMALLRVLADISHDSRLVTSGTISELLLRDQEFIEVHLEGSFGPGDIEEVRQSPDDAAIELTISERERRGLFTTAVEREWARQRAEVARRLDDHDVRHKIVTLHGRGYQWK